MTSLVPSSAFFRQDFSLQGLALVTFFVARTTFTDLEALGFSSSRYAWMSLSQVVMAILTSSVSSRFARRSSLEKVRRRGEQHEPLQSGRLRVHYLSTSVTAFAGNFARRPEPSNRLGLSERLQVRVWPQHIAMIAENHIWPRSPQTPD
jgi:hypothetical protein